MSVFIDGSTLSSILYSHANSGGNQEGVLLGQVVREVKDHISDSQINNCQVHTFIYVSCHIPWPAEDRVYSRGGVPIMEKLAALLGDSHTQEEVVGWYSFRRNSTLRMSMKERNLHKHLEARFSPNKTEQFLFLMCVDTCNAHRSTHCMDHFFATVAPGSGAVKKLSVTVTNLGDTVHTQYKSLAHSAATQSSAVKTILHTFRPQFVSSDGDIQEVCRINDMSKALNTNLMKLCQQVSDSEQQAGELEREVARLREELAQREEARLEEQQREKEREQQRLKEKEQQRLKEKEQQRLKEKEQQRLKDQEEQKEKEKEGQERESLTHTSHLYPSLEKLEPVREAWEERVEGRQGGGGGRSLAIHLEDSRQPADSPSVDDLLSMPPPTTTATATAPIAQLDGLQPQPPPGSGPDPPVLQSVVDTITDTDEEESHASGQPSAIQDSVTGQCQVNSDKNRHTGSGSGQSRSAESLAAPIKPATTTMTGSKQNTSSEGSSKSKDHFSFVDNLLSSESVSSHKKSTATVPTGATLTYSPRPTRSHAKLSSEASTTRERSKPRSSPPRGGTSQAKRESSPKAEGKVTSQHKRDGSPKMDGKPKAASTTRAGMAAEKRLGTGQPSHSVTSNRDTRASRLAQNTRLESRAHVKLDPNNFALGGQSKNRSKVVSAKVTAKTNNEGEKLDCNTQDNVKNGSGEHLREEVPRSLSPVF